MSNDYKLCPKCNNALDHNVIQCPYCGEKVWINLWKYNDFWFNWGKIASEQTKKSGWCWLGCLIFFVLFLVFPFVWGIISLIIEIISDLF